MLTSYDHGRLFGERFGAGDPGVLALPGWGRTHGDFAGVAEGLPFALVALDPPGFGPTPPPDEPWGAADYARCVAPVLDSFEVPPVVVGHSFGGRVAIHLAAGYPAKVGALVLTGAPLVKAPTPGRVVGSPLGYRAVRLARRAHLVSGERLEAARRKYGSEDYRAASGVMRDVLVRAVNETYDAAISAVSCPVELVWGDDDTAAPLAGAVVLQTRIPGAHLTVCPGAGHLTPLTVPGEIRAAIERVAR